jgi:anti-anti-sigma factor
MSSPGFRIEQRQDGRRYALVCSGELDMSQTERLEGAATSACDAQAEEVVLDLQDVVFIDSAGIAAVVNAMQLCERTMTDFFVVPTRAAGPRKVFDVLGLELPWREAESDS